MLLTSTLHETMISSTKYMKNTKRKIIAFALLTIIPLLVNFYVLSIFFEGNKTEKIASPVQASSESATVINDETTLEASASITASNIMRQRSTLQLSDLQRLAPLFYTIYWQIILK